jgi:hemolysin D
MTVAASKVPSPDGLASGQFDPLALDFAPDLLAIQERPPNRLPKMLLQASTGLLALLIVWCYFAELDIIATAEGRLVPVSLTKVVQSAEPGMVTQVKVKDGDLVSEGQVLMRLDARATGAESQALAQDLALRKLTLRRIDAELSDRPFVKGPNDPAELAVQVESQFQARRQAYADSMSQETETLNRSRSELEAAKQTLAKLTRVLPVYLQSAEAFDKLLKEGYVGELAANDRSREALEKEHDLRIQAATVQGLQSAVTQSERRLAALRSQYRAQLADERTETLAALNRVSQEYEKSAVKSEAMEIRAPHSGVVKDLVTTSRGSVVGNGTLLMNIVPQDEPLQAEVLLRNEDVGFTAVGQSAVIKVASFPFQKYGMLEGRVAMISADAMDPMQQQTQGQQVAMTYRAVVHITKSELRSAVAGGKLVLTPGMLVIAEIHQGRRTVLEYLLSPVQKVAQEAARER